MTQALNFCRQFINPDVDYDLRFHYAKHHGLMSVYFFMDALNKKNKGAPYNQWGTHDRAQYKEYSDLREAIDALTEEAIENYVSKKETA